MISLNVATTNGISTPTIQLFLLTFRCKKSINPTCFQMIIPFRLLSYAQDQAVLNDPEMTLFVKVILELTSNDSKWMSLLFTSRTRDEKNLQRKLFIDICEKIDSDEIFVVASPS